MKNVLLIISPSYSHINAVLTIAKHFKRTANRVFFLGTSFTQFDRYIKEQGLDVINADSIPFGMNYFEELTFYKRRDMGFKELLTNRITGELFENRKTFIRNVIKRFEINVIFLDSFIGADILCYYNSVRDSSIELYYVTTMNPQIHKGHEMTDLVSEKSLHGLSLAKYSISYLLEMCYLLGYTTARLIDRKMRELDIGLRDLRVYSKSSIVFYGHTELLLSSKVLSQLNTEGIKYIGAQVDLSRKESVNVRDVDLLTTLVKSNSKLIYVSFGTLCRSDHMVKVIEDILKVANCFNEYSFIFGNIPSSIRSKFQAFRSCNLNVFMFGVVPQLWILSRSVLFITHGGFNSLKEALYFGVPLLSIPATKIHDQYLTAKLVHSIRVGIVLPNNRTGKKQMIKAISLLVEDGAFMDRAKEMQSALRNESQAFNFESFFKSL